MVDDIYAAADYPSHSTPLMCPAAPQVWAAQQQAGASGGGAPCRGSGSARSAQPQLPCTLRSPITPMTCPWKSPHLTCVPAAVAALVAAASTAAAAAAQKHVTTKPASQTAAVHEEQQSCRYSQGHGSWQVLLSSSRPDNPPPSICNCVPLPLPPLLPCAAT